MSKTDPAAIHTWSPSPKTVDELHVEQLRDKRTVDEFIRRWHSMDPVPGWKFVYGAMFKGSVIALVIFGRHYNPDHDTAKRLVITRYVSRGDRPPNTGSWLIARSLKRVGREGYTQVVTFSGVCGNPGTVYKASNFELVEETEADGDGWTNRDSRSSVNDYTRRKWVFDL